MQATDETYIILSQGVYASLGFARTPSDWRNLAILVFLVGGFFGVNWSIKTFNTNQTNRKRVKALQELEKSD